ncbi:3-dehydroquinate synthase [Vulgatibacter sp.]|uniref:3-dehydroquinate synthase n=1 Tax=Vulgatibacter sp. TaxID=1971226 RepID=UPI0035645E1E
MITVPVETPSGAYEVLVGAGLLDTLAARLHGRIAVITDETVLALHGAALPADALVLSVPPGEASKSLAQAERLWTALLAAGIGRSDTIVAFGGGVVGDLAGFVAATLHRGTPFVQVPTTLLAQVDSSVGGKVAIDHPLGKNLIGAFHQPRLVLADLRTLETLPIRERWSGLAEIVKAALLGDLELLALLERDLEAIAERPGAEAVARSIAIKARIVAADEKESGLRRVLNLGHTVGHALEVAAGYGALTHGEAVVYGMRAALRISERYAGLSRADAERALALLRRFPSGPLPVRDTDALLAAAGRDKKREGAHVHYVVLPALGQAATLRADEGMLREAIDAALEEA